jgi:RNA polymerase sigma-70 factor (ECF subfamily)
VTKENAQLSTGFESEALPHLDAVYRFALRLSGAPDLGEDLVQETLSDA